MATKATTTRPACAANTVTTTRAASRAIPATRAIRLVDMALPLSQLPGPERVARRVRELQGRRGGVGAVRRASGVDGAEAADPALEVDHRLVEVAAAHVGPEDLG